MQKIKIYQNKTYQIIKKIETINKLKVKIIQMMKVSEFLFTIVF